MCEKGLQETGDFEFVSSRLSGNLLIRKWVGKVTFQEQMECAKTANGSSRKNESPNVLEGEGQGGRHRKRPTLSWYSLRICCKEFSLLPREGVHSPTKDAVTIAAFREFGMMMPIECLDLCKLLTLVAIQNQESSE